MKREIPEGWTPEWGTPVGTPMLSIVMPASNETVLTRLLPRLVT